MFSLFELLQARDAYCQGWLRLDGHTSVADLFLTKEGILVDRLGLLFPTKTTHTLRTYLCTVKKIHD